MAHFTTNIYLNPTYPETSFAFTVGLYQSIIPSGQGHFAEQPLQTYVTTKPDATIHDKDPYNVGSENAVGLISATSNISDYTFTAFTDNVQQYNDLGISSGTISAAAISFLRPSYSSTLKTSRFPIARTSGIINTQAHSLAIDAATSGGGFNYLSNAHYYTTTKSTVNFGQYQILESGTYSTYTLNQQALSNNLKSISQASGTLSNTLDY
jgi:hypothetical protein